MADIYEQHAKHFEHVSAFVVLDSAGERVATVALKFPRDGAGRLWAYVHVIGTPMTRGKADGYGYDKASAAVYAALGNWTPRPGPSGATDLEPYEKEARARFAVFSAAAVARDGYYWHQNLEAAGYRVLQAV